MDKQVSREDLAVMGMAAKIQVCSGICSFLQLFWLMVNENNRFIKIKVFGQLSRGKPLSAKLVGAGRITM